MKKCGFIFLLFLVSCSPLEISRLIGVGTRPFKTRGKIYSKTFNKDFFSCYALIRRGLMEIDAHFYRGNRKKNFIIATHFDKSFNSCSEATEVAIFFVELTPGTTRIDVSSLNYPLAEFAASTLFTSLEKTTDKVGDEKNMDADSGQLPLDNKHLPGFNTTVSGGQLSTLEKKF